MSVQDSARLTAHGSGMEKVTRVPNAAADHLALQLQEIIGNYNAGGLGGRQRRDLEPLQSSPQRSETQSIRASLFKNGCQVISRTVRENLAECVADAQ